MAIEALGKPGVSPHWTTGGKIGVGTATTGDSNIWFTISHGVINEVYYPRVDIANIRDMGFIVTDGSLLFSEESRHASHDYYPVMEGVPAFKIVNSCNQGRYRIEKIIFADPRRNVLLQKVDFIPLQGALNDYQLYLLLAPHIYNGGDGNTGWASLYKGEPTLFANKRGIALACSCSTPFLNMTCGYSGNSDLWQDLFFNKKLTRVYESAVDGNIALGAKIDLAACGGSFVVALAFAGTPDEAGLQVRASLLRHVNIALKEYCDGWREVQGKFDDLSLVDPEGGKLFRTSTAVLKTHEGKHFSGSVIASLSIPWGSERGDSDLGGYHLIWPRDQVETAQALLAAGDKESARQSLVFLMCTQEQDGHWNQCLWEDGLAYWDHLQMDETALPILLAEHLRRADALQGLEPWTMVAKAAAYILRKGPLTDQDRWEENGGYTAFTLALEISALLVAADWHEERGLVKEAEMLRAAADWWNYSLERWLYVEGTPLASKLNVEGYYVRIRPEVGDRVIIKNRPAGVNDVPFDSVVSCDALALVRLGLRAADDPRILNTVAAIDALLKTTTAKGPVWHRYNGDGYGEHDDGSPFDGTGIGRGWPLLTGERAHYELARGNRKGSLELLRALARFAGEGGLIPEQVWDAPDIPAKTLYNGHSTGSAKPLVWAHAEYVTLLRSLKDGKPFMTPGQTVERYLKKQVPCKTAVWSFHDKFAKIPAGFTLRAHVEEEAEIRWTTDGWKTFHTSRMNPSSFGVWYADLPTEKLSGGGQVIFTFYWIRFHKWEAQDFTVAIESKKNKF